MEKPLPFSQEKHVLEYLETLQYTSFKAQDIPSHSLFRCLISFL